MKGVGVILVCLAGVLLVLVAVAGAGLRPDMGPWSSGRDSGRPPCEQLPDRQAVVDALASHGELVRRMEDIGPGVTVDVATPCDDQPDRAIVRITYATEDEWRGVDAILRQEGFAVAVELISD